ncbi:MAG: aspartate--tRNA(Asn) ligase, partial [Chlamydiia bacterium]|nr:aspartate--tRNA(Asn) ligase [Chlamydiia bacterium]
MMRTLSRDISERIGEEIEVRGWLHSLRSMGKLSFLIVRDRSGLIQVVIEQKEELKKLSGLQPGSVLRVRGTAVAASQASIGVELVSPLIEVEVPIQEVPPVEFNKPQIPSDLEHILDHRAIALRNRELQAVFKIQAGIAHAYRLYMHDVVEAVEYFAPNIIGVSSEGGSECFHVDYFGHSATLAQSSQLYKQIMVGVNERVYALMPFFRAEPSQTTRHLTEGKQLEFEMGYFNHWHEVLDVLEGTMKAIVSHLRANYATEIEILGGRLLKLPKEIPFPRLTFKEAQEIYFERSGCDERNEDDLSPAAERELCRYAQEKYGTDAIFIIDWKTSKRPFYAFVNPDDPKLTNTFDLLCGGTEITSGGQRRHLYSSMVEGIVSKEMNPDDFDEYLSIFKHGMPPHGGFGLGLERLTMTLLGLSNIREASLFPSDPKRIAGKRLRADTVFGGEELRNAIIRLLKQRDIPYDHLKHEPTPTSEDAARVRGMGL